MIKCEDDKQISRDPSFKNRYRPTKQNMFLHWMKIKIINDFYLNCSYDCMKIFS